MAKEVRLSFILPFYGVEKYIGQCLTTIYQQDIPEEEFEVICVNDCSPDNSESIVLEFASKHTNLHLIRHDVNKKLGAARNTGLQAATGKYVWFIDTDDYIQTYCLSHILELCEQNDLEILHFNIQNNYGHVMRRLVSTDVITGPEEELISKKQQSIEITFPWNRVYNREFLLRNNLLFNDLYGGDVIHTILAVNVCQRIMNVDEFFYFYRVDNYSSDTKSAATAEKLFSMNYFLAKAIEDILPQISSKWYSLIDECVEWRVNASIKSILRLPKKEQKKLIRLVENDRIIFDLIKRVGNKTTRLLLFHPRIMYSYSIIYKRLRALKHCIIK